MKNKKRKFRNIIKHFAIKKQFPKHLQDVCHLVRGQKLCDKKTQIPKKSGNGTAVMLDVGHKDLTRPMKTTTKGGALN